MAGITTYLSILTMNVKGLNSPIKRHRLENWIKKEDLTICCLQVTRLTHRNKCWLRVKHQANGLTKQAGVAILISDKVGFKFNVGQMR
jgi:exonuclease III